MSNRPSEFSKVAAVPVTMQHKVPENLDEFIKNPGKSSTPALSDCAPRANYTISKEHPNPTYDPPKNKSVLQMHLDFWDRDGDGILWPKDTYAGFQRLGFPTLISLVAVPIIHGTFAYWSGDSWLPDPMFRILFKNAHRTKHGSDSETYDTEGRFVPEKFEEIFSKYDVGGKGGLTLSEVQTLIRSNRNIMDPIGWTAEWLEWMTSYYMIAKETPRGKMLMKEDVRGIIDGTIFYRIARDVEEGKLKRKGVFVAGLEPVSAGAGGASKSKVLKDVPKNATRKEE